ncbi:MAG: DUF4179 domain-containing protein [Succinimonas sp.]|nr:DUF4179 domain-containing protein [Succinimonas sp.]
MRKKIKLISSGAVLLALMSFVGAFAETANTAASPAPEKPEIDVEANIADYLNRPLDEAMQDVEAITALENTPENLAQNSNGVLKLESVFFDKQKMTVVYTFQIQVEAGADEVQKFITEVTQDFHSINCENSNFPHAMIGNTYVIRDFSGKEAARIESRYENCPGVSSGGKDRQQ